MDQRQDNPDLRPLTVAHGKKLFAKSTSIAEQVDQLKPLLSLLQPEESGDQDPVQQITALLENLTAHVTHQTTQIQLLGVKIDALFDVLSASEP